MPLTQIVRYSWKRDGFRIIRPDRLIAGDSSIASSRGGSPDVVTGGATCCSSVLSSRNVTRRRVCSVASLMTFSACSSLRCDLVLRNLVQYWGLHNVRTWFCTLSDDFARTPVVSLFVENPHALPSKQSRYLGTGSLIVGTYHAVSALL